MSVLKDIASLRREYSGAQLSESEVDPDPLKQFEIWMGEALEANVQDPHAMVLSTISRAGKPSSRVVLLRDISSGCFVFYTNYESRKGEEIRENANAAVVFFWPELDRQIRAEGEITRTDKTESDRYFASRPRPSQIAAWASKQSSVLSGRDELERRFREVESEFKGRDVPRPENWGGYRIRLRAVEFWQGRPNRLHDRIRYTLDGSNRWVISRLAP
ncbi:MAG: pyridoxamine 5'-phosphate oxidase [Bacteroidetes bacterium]|nr:pyridoxamine 5'-phosphate oxidase [Bacteroidota bacterium]